MTTSGLWVRLAAFSGLVSVIAGALGVHAMASHPLAQDLIKTGAQYEAIHAIAAVVAVSLARDRNRGGGLAPALFLAGSLLFSGSLYALALGAPRLIGAVTPFGGLTLMAGWIRLIWTGGTSRP